MSTVERPMDSKITGTVAIATAPLTSVGWTKIKGFLAGRYNCRVRDMKYMDEDKVDMGGLYLEPQLYSKANIEKVEQALWVLTDVVGNVELEDWATETTGTFYIESVGRFRIHVGNQHYMDVALRVLVIEFIF